MYGYYLYFTDGKNVVQGLKLKYITQDKNSANCFKLYKKYQFYETTLLCTYK